MRLRVAVDATAVPSQRAGAGRYVVELMRAIDPGEVELHIFVKDVDVEEFAVLLPSAELHIVNVSSRAARIAWGHSMLSARARAVKPDVFHGPHYTLPRGLSCPAVVTFHDPTFFTHPKLHERTKVVYFRRAARSGIRRAARVIAPSEYAGRGAVERAGARPDAMDVVPHGVDHSLYRPASHPQPDVPFVLFVGTLEPRKDVPTLIAAWDALDVRHDLVIVGQRGWGTHEIDAAVANAVKKDRIRMLGYVDDEAKVRLYRDASAFVYPSIAEGFGLPVLEALACGAPVITTTGSAPEEVAGPAASLVPAGDRDALSDAIARVLSDRSLEAALRKQGPERAASFTWDGAAAATVDAWRRSGDRR